MRSDQDEAARLRIQAKQWMDDLTLAGVSTNTMTAGVLTALIERTLINQGTDKTVAWLRAQADFTEKVGDELLRALKN